MPRCFALAQLLMVARQTNSPIQIHSVHPQASSQCKLASETKKAGVLLRRYNENIPAVPVDHFCTGVLTGDDITATLWDDGEIIDLTSMLNATGLGWVLWYAYDINDLGQIVGYGLNAAGLERGFLLTPNPVPLPAAFPLLGGALSLLGFFGWCRKRMIVA